MDDLETILARLELIGWSIKISIEPASGCEVSARVEHNAYSCSCHPDLLAAVRDLEKNLAHRIPPPAYVPQKAVIRPTIDPESLL